MIDLTPKGYKILSAEEEIVVETNQSLSDFVGQQNFKNPTVMQQGYFKSNNFLTGVSGWRMTADGDLEANSGTFRGSLIAGNIHIPDQDTSANSVHIDGNGNAWWGATKTDFTADNGNAKAYVLKTGSAKFQDIEVGGVNKQYKLGDDGIFTFGDGSDGALTTTGNVTLTSDKYYTNLTIATGHIFNPNGWRVFVNGTLTLEGTGKISRNGNNGANGANAAANKGGAGGSGGAALADGYLKGSLAGVAGGIGEDGGYQAAGKVGGNSAGANRTNSIGSNASAGGVGGTGGDGDSGVGGSGGTSTAGTITASNVKLIANWHLATLLDISSTGATVKYDNSASASGGSGGGSGGGASGQSGGGAGAGGGAGSGGGIIAIYAKKIVIGASAIIEANGGNGGNGGTGGNSAAANTGGGGGGGAGAGGNGGQIILVYNELTNDGSITVTAGTAGTGGTFGTGVSTGTDGTAGSNGTAGTVGTIRMFSLSL